MSASVRHNLYMTGFPDKTGICDFVIVVIVHWQHTTLLLCAIVLIINNKMAIFRRKWWMEKTKLSQIMVAFLIYGWCQWGLLVFEKGCKVSVTYMLSSTYIHSKRLDKVLNALMQILFCAKCISYNSCILCKNMCQKGLIFSQLNKWCR